MSCSRPATRWLTQWEYAHRGLHAPGVPENSLAAAMRAIDAGLGIECDIQRSSDNQAMVFHDWELDRMTATSGAVEDFTQTDLEAVPFCEGGETIPSLEALLNAIDGRVPLLIEVKSKPDYDVEASCEAISALVNDYPYDHAVMSFDPRVAMWFRDHSPRTVSGLVMREDSMGYTQTQKARLEAFNIARPDFMAYHVAALPNPWVEQLRAQGMPVLTWTVNSQETRESGQRHADALITEGTGFA